MRLYHALFSALRLCLLAVCLTLVAACVSAPAAVKPVSVLILADNEEQQIQLAPGSTVQQALDQVGLSLGDLDRVEPQLYQALNDGAVVRLVRVTEKFEVEQVVTPFERQVVRNESLPSERQVLLQGGQNGLQEITYRRVFEDGVEITAQPIPIKIVQVSEAMPEIIMVGIQAPFAPILIPGRLVYLRDGNAWAIEGATANRRAVVSTGDLDGRVFTLSQDGSRLLFTRLSDDPAQINSLWAVDLTVEPEQGESLELVDLKVPNVVHFAAWVPGSTNRIVFSTVEPRQAAPGWQANNDLKGLTFSPSGWTTQWSEILAPNSGGIYGWWGTDFRWSPDGRTLAYSRPDEIGLINYNDALVTPLQPVTPLQTGGDWAWVPGLDWSADGQTVYTVAHVPPPGSAVPEESQDFALAAVQVSGGPGLVLVQQTGMFAYPQVAPDGEQVAYLQAIFPTQSDDSRYRLGVMDRDGSNQQVIFPAQGAPGLDPQRDWGVWSPQPVEDSARSILAVIYQGNLWFVDPASGQANQITADALTTRVDWK